MYEWDANGIRGFFDGFPGVLWSPYGLEVPVPGGQRLEVGLSDGICPYTISPYCCKPPFIVDVPRLITAGVTFAGTPKHDTEDGLCVYFLQISLRSPDPSTHDRLRKSWPCRGSGSARVAGGVTSWKGGEF